VVTTLTLEDDPGLSEIMARSETMQDRERVKRALAAVQTAAELLAGLETPLPLGQVLAHLNADAQLLRGLNRRLSPVPTRRRRPDLQAG
jgi:hypothetical protein